MSPSRLSLLIASCCLGLALPGFAEVRVVVAKDATGADFRFKNVPAPRRGDAGAKATIKALGKPDENSGGIDALQDGLLPTEPDEPISNFFFGADNKERRLLIDLGRMVPIKEINTYSWHPNARAPQVYRLYASDGAAREFRAEPETSLDPATCGWKKIADVDTRPASGRPDGGQYAVSILDTTGLLGAYRYLLMEVSPTDPSNPESDTFYSEIDVVDRDAPAADDGPAADTLVDSYQTSDGKYRFNIISRDAPDLREWSRRDLAPVLLEWYPKIAKLLGSDGFSAPRKFTIKFSNNYEGVAATIRTYVACSPKWYRGELHSEAIGATVHELVHVVQQYWDARPRKAMPPSWLTEGIADYVRWYLYEPKFDFNPGLSRLAETNYDGSYKVTASFLIWASDTYDPALVPKLNAAARQGKYDEKLWKTFTGHSLAELNDQWRRTLAEKAGLELAAPRDPKARPALDLKDSHRRTERDAVTARRIAALVQQNAAPLPLAVATVAALNGRVQRATADFYTSWGLTPPADDAPHAAAYREQLEQLKADRSQVADFKLSDADRANLAKPEGFAQYQLLLLDGALVLDDAQWEKVKAILSRFYAALYAKHLNRDARPKTGVEKWQKQRDELAAAAMTEIEKSLTPGQLRNSKWLFQPGMLFRTDPVR